jgi:hypothetical protein
MNLEKMFKESMVKPETMLPEEEECFRLISIK